MNHKIIVKTCITHGDLTADQIKIYFEKRKNKNRIWCLVCIKERSIKTYQKDKERIKKRSKAHREKHPEKMQEWKRKWKKTEKGKMAAKKYKENSRADLKTSYIKDLLVNTGWTRKNITDEIIETKKALVEINRIIKENK